MQTPIHLSLTLTPPRIRPFVPSHSPLHGLDLRPISGYEDMLLKPIAAVLVPDH